ncbi:MAG: hypothetical protein QOE86_3050 [Solirubrobacteraceae bacterium]|nr:hypothetical protein [Solirubrobacteraceae bacterium]
MGLDELRHLWRVPAGRWLVCVAAALLLATAIAMGALWPGRVTARRALAQLSPPTVAARVTATRLVGCPGRPQQRCLRAQVRVGSQRTTLDLGPAATAPSVGAGTAIRVSRTQLPRDVPAAVRRQTPAFNFVDIDRHRPVLVLAAALAVLAIIALRGRGLLAVLGVGLSLLLVTTFVVPALLAGKPALAVALVGSLAVAFVTLVLTNGVGAQTMAALVSIACTLAVTSVAAVLVVHAAHLDGRTTELASTLLGADSTLSLQGIVLAGMLVGALGVLADTAVTQASAVMALRRANPGLRARQLYRGAVVVGRDHLSATIHTLVLAYVGVALPLLLALRAVGVRTVDALNSQDVAEPILAAVIGCLALLMSVPLTTFLASRLVTHIPVELLPEHDHAH